MRLEIAIGVSLVLLFFALVLIAEMLRHEVHAARNGNREVVWSDVRFVNDFLGKAGIWNSHKGLYERSQLRACFRVVLIAFVGGLALGACVYIHARL